MKINKLIITQVPMDISIKEITLLSVEEYERYKEHISEMNHWWWLRSPGGGGRSNGFAAGINGDGEVDYYGGGVNYNNGIVRPVVVLQLSELESLNPQVGDKLEIAGHTWTMIAENMALCDDSVGRTYFREDWPADDANEYASSDIKKWLEAWAMLNGIIAYESLEPTNETWLKFVKRFETGELKSDADFIYWMGTTPIPAEIANIQL